MGKLTIEIDAGTPYYGVTEIVTDCYSQTTVTVESTAVTRHIEIITNDNYGSPALSGEIITADKQYNMWVYGDTNNNQSISSVAIMNIRDTSATGDLLATIRVQRFHNGQYC